MNNKYCAHCWPTQRKSHFILHFDYYLNKFIKIFLKPFEYLSKKSSPAYSDYFLTIFFGFLYFFRIAKFISQPDESKLYNRSLIFFKEAKKINLDIKAVKIFGKYINEFKLAYKNKNYYYQDIPLTIFGQNDFHMDNKYACKQILQTNNLPIAHGQLFTNISKALKFGNEMGFPLVVKPYDASLSNHVTCQITSDKELLKGIKIAKQYAPAFIVEKHIDGHLFRASVVGKKHVFICQKERANIEGDGYLSIEELINLKNSHVNRGDTGQMNSTLHKIPINDVLITNLKNQGLNLKTVPLSGHKIYLQDKYILSNGCDIINCGQFVHPDNKELFFKVANVLQSDLIGIDFICPDISQSHALQETAILEVNSLPYIDMHQYPSHGNSEPVAEIVWDIVLDKLENK